MLAKSNSKSRKATAKDILLVLSERSVDILRRIPVSPIQLSFPTDGKGARIRVSVSRGQKPKVPSHIELSLDSDTVQFPLETIEDYQDYKLQACLNA